MGNILYKNRWLVSMMILSLLFNVQAQDIFVQNRPELPQTIHPSKGIVITVLSIMFTITFLLLAYVKFCRDIPRELLNQNQNFHGLTRSRSRFSGIDRQVIETLPFFKFSSLKGSKEGLECTVCLSEFEDIEILRLLPKCQHAFHVNCIDKWLENHSTCPLCRYRVEPGDIKNLTYSLSSRSLRGPSNLNEDPNLEFFVQREPSHRGSSGFDTGSAFWDSSGGTKWEHVHELNHKIVISDVVTRSRWSDLNSSDLLSLNCEMIHDMCSTRFSPLENTRNEKFHGTSSLPSTSNEEENSFTALNSTEKRSMSDIANVPRFAEINKQNRIREYVASSGDNRSEERLCRIWLPIARRTVQWIARQERNSVELEHKPLASNV
ncbi:E3 ubiquitin-protein ligase ATL42-like [Gastrolobium bilobum]|uniref:E3 ubiquitin-protein ligase ATL42-like n=1 Tax=Gastrolobium bilobum TaxID=150636 RepID=UPI002AAFF5A3|nr:E3 ubiquitin-protein ligase ATL42-like [Gastrolobium bilobum]